MSGVDFKKIRLIVLLGFLCMVVSGFASACSESGQVFTSTGSSYQSVTVQPSDPGKNSTPNPAFSVLPGTSIKMTLSPGSFKQGENLVAEVRLGTRYALRGAQWTLAFDPSIMRCDGGSEGSFFRDWAKANSCSTTVFPALSIDNQTGKAAEMGVAVMGQTRGGPTGSGVIYTYRFLALADASSFPRLSGVAVADAAGKMYPVDVSSP